MDESLKVQLRESMDHAVKTLAEIMRRNPGGWDNGPEPITYSLLGTALATAIAALDSGIQQAAHAAKRPGEYVEIVAPIVDGTDKTTANLIGKISRDWRRVYAPLIQRASEAMRKPVAMV